MLVFNSSFYQFTTFILRKTSVKFYEIMIYFLKRKQRNNLLVRNKHLLIFERFLYHIINLQANISKVLAVYK